MEVSLHCRKRACVSLVVVSLRKAGHEQLLPRNVQDRSKARLTAGAWEPRGGRTRTGFLNVILSCILKGKTSASQVWGRQKEHPIPAGNGTDGVRKAGYGIAALHKASGTVM